MTASATETGYEELAAAIRGDLIRPDDPGYDQARAVYNAMIDKHPQAIARVRDTADVIACVRFATLSTRNTDDTCIFTVTSATPSRNPISLLGRWSSDRISSCRGVSGELSSGSSTPAPVGVIHCCSVA